MRSLSPACSVRTPDETEERLLARLAVPLEKVAVELGITEMLAFYAQERAEGCDLEADGDMLLYQWGTYDWGEGKHFELDITRQFITEDDDEPVQLSLTFRFKPTAGFTQLSSGNRWCHGPAELDDFRAFILGTPAFVAATKVIPLSVELDLEFV